MNILDLRQTIDLLALVERDTRLKRVGAGWYAGSCPFCGGTDRFVLKQTTEGWRWLCRRCTDSKYLDAVDYLQRRDTLSFAEAVKTLGGDLSLSPLRRPPVQPESQKKNMTKRFIHLVTKAGQRLDNPNDEFGTEVRAYLDKRGLIEPTWQRALLGAAEVYDPKAGCKRPAVSIPYFDRNYNVQAIKYRFTDAVDGLRYISEKGSQAGIYYLPDDNGMYDKLLILEGEFNLLSVEQVLPELDLISTGSQSLSESMKQTLTRLAGHYRKVWVWMDEPQKAAEIAQLVRGIPIQSPIVEGVKFDANRILQADMLHEFISRLTGVRCYGWMLESWRQQETGVIGDNFRLS